MKSAVSKIILTSLILTAGAQTTPAKAIDIDPCDVFGTTLIFAPYLVPQVIGWTYLLNRKWSNKPISTKQLGICHLPTLGLACFLAWQTP